MKSDKDCRGKGDKASEIATIQTSVKGQYDVSSSIVESMGIKASNKKTSIKKAISPIRLDYHDSVFLIVQGMHVQQRKLGGNRTFHPKQMEPNEI